LEVSGGTGLGRVTLTKRPPGFPGGFKALRALALRGSRRPNIGSRVNREVHARFWEQPEVKSLRLTRLLSNAERMTDERSVCFVLSMNSRTSVSQSGASESSTMPTSLSPWRTSSSCVARCPNSCVQTTSYIGRLSCITGRKSRTPTFGWAREVCQSPRDFRNEEKLAAIANTGSDAAVAGGSALTVLNTGCRSERKTRTLSTRSRVIHAPPRHVREGFFHSAPPPRRRDGTVVRF
jgi:hypothetical protein